MAAMDEGSARHDHGVSGGYGRSAEPIAILGMGCRLPGGVGSPDELWQCFVGERDGPVPGRHLDGHRGSDPDAPAATSVHAGARGVDPRQRLVLETTREALERARIDPSSLRGSDTGVYIGSQRTGPTVSVAASRVAHALGLTGLAVTVDTACSSWLVAVQLAMQALRSGDCDMAVVGRATVVCSPSAHVGSRRSTRSADGRFGVGVLVLAKVSRAWELGCPVLALVPGGPQRVIRQALRGASMSVTTGTRLGDPIDSPAWPTTYVTVRPFLVGAVTASDHPAGVSRASYDRGAVVVGAARDGLLRAPAPNVATGKAADRRRAAGGTVFVFPGQVSQWHRLAAELLDTAPAFADEMRRCDEEFAEFVDWSLLDVVRADSPPRDRVDVAQPALFAVTVSLAALWRATGVHPDAVLGHAQGEIAAAYVADALSLRDAAKVVTLRSKAVGTIAGTGGMVSIPRPVHQVCALIAPWGGSISIAAQDGPSSTVVSGSAADLDELTARCVRDHIRATRLPVDYASHSADMEVLREDLRESLSGLQPRAGAIAFVSSVTGAGLDTSILDGDYWFANLRQPVLFEQSIRWLHERGYRTFVESSPHPVLTAGIGESLQDCGDERSVVGALRRNDGGL